jgi:hypothetical protein
VGVVEGISVGRELVFLDGIVGGSDMGSSLGTLLGSELLGLTIVEVTVGVSDGNLLGLIVGTNEGNLEGSRVGEDEGSKHSSRLLSYPSFIVSKKEVKYMIVTVR